MTTGEKDCSCGSNNEAGRGGLAEERLRALSRLAEGAARLAVLNDDGGLSNVTSDREFLEVSLSQLEALQAKFEPASSEGIWGWVSQCREIGLRASSSQALEEWQSRVGNRLNRICEIAERVRAETQTASDLEDPYVRLGMYRGLLGVLLGTIEDGVKETTYGT